jgi:hypothetical protein
MPATQLEVVDARRHRVRHILPWTAGEDTTQSAQSLFGKSYAFSELPITPLPTDRSFSEGDWLSRLGDAGEFHVTFPNKEAPNGPPWRERFSTFGHLEFVEIYRDDVLEHVDVILAVEPDQQKVVISGQDGWFLLRDAYQRDQQVVMAPRDVIERYSYVWAPIVADNFIELNATRWSSNTFLEGESPTKEKPTVSIAAAATGGVLLTCIAPKETKSRAWLESKNFQISDNNRWSLTANFVTTQASGTNQTVIILREGQAGGELFFLIIEGLTIRGSFGNSFGFTSIALPQGFAPGPHSFLVECDGRFMSGYIDGYLIAVRPVPVAIGAVSLGFEVAAGTPIVSLTGASSNQTLLQEVLFRELQPFLMRGAEKGDYVLPGDTQTYPYGGLNGRYYNDADIAEESESLNLRFAPNRTGTGPGGSYKDRTDAGIVSGLEPPFPGAAATSFSVRWFGAIYLKLSQGNYVFEMGRSGAQVAFRVWIGKTQFGQQIIDSWSLTATTNPVEGTVNAAALGKKDGWYPIIIELARGTVANVFQFYCKTAPAVYTDPGGTSINTGSGAIVVPATSLSPLGCVDQHYQGQSHFNITKETAEAFGLQMYCEPRQLESGEFPGQLVPQARVGHDTDEIVEKDDLQSKSPMVNYKNKVDATDMASSIRGTGAGLPNGQNGQIQVEEFDIPTMQESLFDLQGWVDASDINSPSLLATRIASQLDLQTEPWQNIEGEPIARDRLADTFPLTGALSAMRWTPGMGVRIYLPEINVQDIVPRQIMQVTRQFGPVGRHGTQMGFRQRPIDRLSQVNKLIRSGAQSQRNYQRQVISLPVKYSAAGTPTVAAGETIWASVPLQPSDKIVSAKLVIATNSAAQKLTIENLPGASFAVVSGFPAFPTIVPLVIDVSTAMVCRFLSGVSSGAAYIGIKNAGSSSTLIEFHLAVTVLR